ncbi:MAG: tetratricopeptide repeat protein [Candidatus Peregrinibacteria bacterium]|nr:tetratricopeptide repeat protein [Candidatus Peregrinibacteria bacterium]
MKTNQMNYDDFTMELLEKAESAKLSGDFEGAIKILQKVILSNHECFEAFEEMGDNYMSLRELKKAKKALDRATKIQPKSANAHYLLGFLYSLDQKWKDSIKELQQADELFPNHPEILRCLGWSFYNENRKAQGIAVLERSKNLSPTDANILCDLGVCYMNSAAFQKAKESFEQVLKVDPNSDQAKESLEFLKILRAGEK